MHIKAVAFDVDGTLYPRMGMVLSVIPIFLRFPVFTINFNSVRKAIRKIRPIKNFRELQARLLAKKLKKPEEKIRILIDEIIYDRWENSFEKIKPYPGIKDLVIQLKNKNIKLAILSDFPVKRKIKFLNILKKWDVAFCSEETDYLKPNPEPFKKLSKALGILPENILYVGDDYQYDIEGAARVGMKTAYLSRKKIKNSKADIIFKNYFELKNILLDML